MLFRSFNGRITEAEEQISGLEDKIVEITTTQQMKEKGKNPPDQTNEEESAVYLKTNPE